MNTKANHFFNMMRTTAVASVSLAILLILQGGGCPGGLAPSGPPGGGPFSFTASVYDVNIPQNVSSAPVEFRITSDGTFSGDVVVHWEETGDCSPSPADNDVTLSVAPGAPAVFTRKMYRWSATGRNLRWTATHQPSSTVKSFDIAFTH